MKQRKLNKRKGFTLVELLVVIAILAVLATVSVVGYTSFTKKAKVSNDVSLTTQMNTILQANEVTDGKNATPHEAVEELLAGGLDVTKLTPTANDYNYVWDSTQNRIFLLDEDNKVVSPTNLKASDKAVNLFAFVGKESDLEEAKYAGYSFYLKNNFESDDDVTVKTGVDTGNNNISKLTYTNTTSTAQNVVVRTNGGELTVDADTDTVYHYGSSSKVTIIAVAGNSYHENGTVTGNHEVLKGRVELGKAADVNTVLVKSATANDVKVDVVSGAKVGSVAPTTDAAKSDIDASTTIPTDSKVTEVVDTTKTEMFAGGLGTEKSPYLVANEEQLLAISTYSDVMKNGNTMSFKLSNNIDLSTKNISESYVSTYFCGVFDGNDYNLVVNDSINGIFGAAVNNVSIKNIKLKLFNNPVKLCSGVSVSTGANIIMDNVEINTLNSGDYVKLGKNVGLYFDIIGFDEITKKWCDNHRSTVLIKNCNGLANISAESYNAVFVGGMLNNADVTVINSTYGGQYYGEFINLVYGNTFSDSNWNSYVNSTMTIENVKNVGAMYGTARAALIAGGATNVEASAHTTIKNCSIGTTRALTDSSLSVSTNDEGNVVIGKATNVASYYVLTFVGGERRIGEYTTNSSYRFNIKVENIEFENNKFLTNYKLGKMVTVDQYKDIDSSTTIEKGTGNKLADEAGAEYWIKEYEGTTYYVFSFDNSYYHFESSHNVSGPANINKVLVTIYDEDGKPIAQSSSK